jgi:hypothetical protein
VDDDNNEYDDDVHAGLCLFFFVLQSIRNLVSSNHVSFQNCIPTRGKTPYRDVKKRKPLQHRQKRFFSSPKRLHRLWKQPSSYAVAIGDFLGDEAARA